MLGGKGDIWRYKCDPTLDGIIIYPRKNQDREVTVVEFLPSVSKALGLIPNHHQPPPTTITKNKNKGWMWWLMSLISALRRQSQEDLCEFKFHLEFWDS